MKKHADLIPRKNIFDLDLNHSYLFFRRTKIVATIGPSSSSPELIKELLLKGLNVARINFSHGNPEDHLKVIQTIRKVSKEIDKPVAILGDLCGPKIRVGKFRNDCISLIENSIVHVTVKTVMGDEAVIPCQYKKLVSEVSVGDKILLDDGNMELQVLKINEEDLEARVLRGGILKNNKGMNLPDTKMNIPALTAKDRKDASYCIEGQVDYIALSFVRKPEDVIDLKRLLQRRKADISVIAKIEKPEALENINDILSVADGIMIARGDLGVELPAKKVPFIQNKLIEACIQQGKPVIVATQMLESMIEHSRPTRAEVTDVATACLAGADAVMLSAETASGKYPVEAVNYMDMILREAEAYRFFSHAGVFRDKVSGAENLVQKALSTSIAQLSRDLMVRCITVLTLSGRTAVFISSDRPAAPILALTPSESVSRKLQLIWGTYPFLVSSRLDVNDSFAYAEAYLKKIGLAFKNDFMLLVDRVGDVKNETHSISIRQVT